MNIQEFSNLKVGDMVKVKCPICHDCGHCYIAKVTDKITRQIWKPAFAYPSYITTENVIKIDQHGYTNFEFDMSNIVRKLPKPEKRTAYWCKTRDAAEKFLEDCEAWGIKWCGGENATKADFWYLGDNGVMFYLRDRGILVIGERCMTWAGRTTKELNDYDYMNPDIDRYIEYPSGKVLWDRAEEEAKKKAAGLVSFKVRCVKAPSDSSFTLGNIYDWVDGTLYGDKGQTFIYTVASTNPDEWKFAHTKFVKVDEEELKAEETLAEAINNLGKAATLGSEIIKYHQEAWTKFAKMYADTDSIKCCCKNKCCSCANSKPRRSSGRYPWGVKEVKRPAKVGEYIKIVAEQHSSLSCGKYTNGDIGLVTMLYGSAIKATINGYENVPVARWEYVVLENYIPEVKEVKRPAKVGEYVKIVDEWHPVATKRKYTNGDIGLVTREYVLGTVKVTINGHENVSVATREYVVLENYRP